MNAPKSTPMIQQYLCIKEKHKDAILFYRMGDFYEMFFEDAQVASRVLEITLTSRNKNEAVSVPMCGIPHRAAQAYIARLIGQGYKVAICDQIEDPALAKGLVKREVVRVITPGMIVENELLDAKANNYILALARHQETCGLSSLDISTGLFRVVESIHPSKIIEELQRIGPKEILLPAVMHGEALFKQLSSVLDQQAVNRLEEEAFDINRGRKRLIDQFQTRSLEGFGCQEMTAGLGAAGALLCYVQETQKQLVTHIRRIETYSLEEHLVIDHMSRQNLELEKNIRNGSRQGTLIGILDQTSTAMGGRLLRHWLRYPLRSPEKIGDRLDAVEELLLQGDIRRRLIESLSGVYDLERLNARIAMGHANARDVLSLGRSLGVLPNVLELLAGLNSEQLRFLSSIEELTALSGLIERAIREDAPPGINEGGMINIGFNEELDQLMQTSRDAKGYLAQLEGLERQATGIGTLKVRFNKVFGYYIEVSKGQAKLVPAHYIRKQTLVNAERYITDELKQFETRVLGAEDRRCVLELEIFNHIREKVRESSVAIQETAGFVARLDCLLALAEAADQNDYTRPKINTLGIINIREGRHPVVEKTIHSERFVPNSVYLDNDNHQVLIITGPNMAGKSTVLRQVALLVIMSQIGSFVPAVEADLAVTDRIFTRVGALDNLSAGQSTFMVEMEETANILNNATADSLVIMDEIGRGTSTYDGLSIAWAVVEYLHDLKGKGTKTLFATHYHELTELARTKARIKNFNIAVKEWRDGITFLRKLVPGGTNRSYGIQVARLAGIPEQVIEQAKSILERIEGHAPEGSDLFARSTSTGKEKLKPVQMELFQPVDKEIVAILQCMDLNRLTPIEALNLLHDLQKRMRESH
ncbi:MAG: DNA mismatch repair protein MutS [Desulfobacteraceae bacterium]|nr:MAG: DNA mismatch repair protein MutS [Desulfobacteraceae bacterium]